MGRENGAIRRCALIRNAGRALWLVIGPGVFASSALAQPAEPPPGDRQDVGTPGQSAIGNDGSIIVTGTLVRGIAPVGNSVITMSRQQIEETGAATSAELLQSIPQLPSFNTLQFPIARCNCQTVNRPNLRGLTPLEVTGSSTTLVLVDGHRVVGMGVLSTTPDPDIVPPAMLERVEMVLDGGSSIYGSDAVSGVMNFVTRKKEVGLRLDARYGFADDYGTFDANATVGKEWQGGSAFISYNYVEHDALFGRDRDYVRRFPSNVPGIPFPVTSLTCSPGNVQLVPSGAVFRLPYAAGAAIPNTVNQCDNSDGYSIYPRQHRHSVFAGITQELADGITLDIRGYFLDRREWQTQGGFYQSVFLGPATIFGRPTGIPLDSPFRQTHLVSGNPFEVQQVSFAFGDAESASVRASLRTWGITPTLTAELGGDWQLRALGSFGYSRTESHTGIINLAAFNRTILAGLFNPYDPASSDPRALESIENFETYGLNRQNLYNVRVDADGTLLRLPGGAVKLAVGAEFLRESIWLREGNTVPGAAATGAPAITLPANLPGAPLALIRPASAPLPVKELSRDNRSLFGELVVPLIGEDNAGPGLREVSLSASARYDNYGDVGETFNPKFGFTWRPVDWLKLRGAWGRSFVAPALTDLHEAVPTQLGFATNVALLFPPVDLIANGTWPAPKPGQNTVAVLGGSRPGLQPQKARSLSLGVDLEPRFAHGLNLSVTYWKTDYDGGIAVPQVTLPATYWRAFASSIIVNPTLAQLGEVAGLADNIVGSPCAPLPDCVYAILDDRRRNMLTWKLDGLDFAARFARNTRFGSVRLDIDASYTLTFKARASVDVPYFDQVGANASRFRLRASLGARIGGRWTVATNLNHTGGYRLDPAVGIEPQQTHVGSFDVINLAVKYEFHGFHALKGMSLSLNIDNLFDQDPPEFRETNIDPMLSGYANGATLGRLVRFGIAKQF
jgi:iron complex outermembrane receptor protein